ncbi:hypothetical protein [Urechidicola croceus]|uniref:Diacylglycerol glucosyltransferase N-terminal domain-containing protein n=1 Tax=Urechidicola croceus TaxID=1850246 RepID=A0A1D8P4M7_9FLAO|nr:hypothetical protein [Urechidicola croceus]AOW19514.1 hypothetical protein LPB138_01935 [Urechidicola croceus]
MKKIGIIIPDGTGIRNYLYSNVVKSLIEKDCEIILLHSISQAALDEINHVHGIQFKAVQIPQFIESLQQRFIRETISYARLLRNKSLTKNDSLLNNWRPKKSNFKKKYFYNLVEFVGRNISRNYSKIVKYEAKYQKAVAKNNQRYVEIVKSLNLDLIFSTHQRAMNAIPIVVAAKILNVKTVGAIFSWDNVPKARLSARTNEYIVWSQYMKEEMSLYYPEISENNITITGTPQFEFYYNEKNRYSKDTFYDKFNLDKNKRIICFSGDDALTSPFDPEFLTDIVKVIDTNKLNIQILLRRAPVDVSGRFDSIVNTYPEIIKNAPPLWNFDKNSLQSWQTVYPTFEDIKLLISTAFYCEAVINLGSTMAHDFAIFNKPAVYVNYNPVISKTWNIDTIYKFQHFRSMGDLKPVIWLNSKDEIETVLKKVLNNPILDNEKWLNVISENRNIASENIAKKLVSCI